MATATLGEIEVSFHTLGGLAITALVGFVGISGWVAYFGKKGKAYYNLGRLAGKAHSLIGMMMYFVSIPIVSSGIHEYYEH